MKYMHEVYEKHKKNWNYTKLDFVKIIDIIIFVGDTYTHVFLLIFFGFQDMYKCVRFPQFYC